ncbi:MAG: dimethylarginine dimethylaminohydrolase family protein [Elusimicrobiota bacterium]
MNFPRDCAAYQGRGWRPRLKSLSAELAEGRGIWAPWRVDSEYKRLQAVLLYCPGSELRGVRSPNAVQHVGRIAPAAIKREFDALASVLRRLGVEVHFLPRAFGAGPWPRKHNLMFVRDLFFNTREGAVVARMASVVRAGEEKHASLALSALGVPINRTISGAGLFEGADAVWLDSKTVLCGVGNRTNAEGFRQLREALRPQGVEALASPLPRGVQHLMGILQIVDSDLALLRASVAPRGLARLLEKRAFTIVPVPESDETLLRQGMNVVTAAPRTIVMPRACPALKRLYVEAGMTVAAEVEIGQIMRGAGGLACAAGILGRRI